MAEVQPLPPRDLLLILTPPSPLPDGPPRLRLRLSAHLDGARLHLQQGRVHSHRGSHAPVFDRLGEELLDSTLKSIEQVGADRIALLEFSNCSGNARRALLLEFLGRHSNMALLGPEDSILEVLVPQADKPERPARLAKGRTWSPPGGSLRPPDKPQPSIEESYPDPDTLPPGPVKDRAPLSWRVECALGLMADATVLEQDRSRLIARLERRLNRARSALKGIEKRALAAGECERIRQDGELLKSVLGTLRRGMTEATVSDWFAADMPQRKLALDPKLTPSENLEKVFARVHKLEKAQATLEQDRNQASSRISRLEELAAQALTTEDPLRLDTEAVQAGLLETRQEANPRKKKPRPARLPYRTFQTDEGLEIRVGRTAKDNDDLTLHHSRGLDLWLHTQDVPGSHVILRTGRGVQPSEQAIVDAALLAVHFSPARGASQCDVHLVERKHVHKPKGAKPGLVTLAGGKILRVRAQPKRLASLLRGSAGH
ncbi:MAG: NFACT RNA binding domain-containing protein [bacterium]